MHLVFDAFLPRPICISSPNLTKLLWINNNPDSSWRQSSKGKAPSSTYKTQNKVSTFPCENVFPLCPVSVPMSCGEWERCCNVIMFKPAFVHSFSIVSAKAITTKRNNTGAIQSPSLTPTFWLIVSLVFPILRTTFKSWYILATEERSFGGGHHISSKSEASECDQRYQTPWKGPKMRHKWVSRDCVLCGVTFLSWTFHLGIQLQVRIQNDISLCFFW